jgi:hypothetical protein
MKKFAFLARITAVVTYGQAPASSKSKSDLEKIASPLGAGPKSVTRNATVLDWPTSPGGEFHLLRAGTNGWTGLPGFLGGSQETQGDVRFLRPSWLTLVQRKWNFKKEKCDVRSHSYNSTSSVAAIYTRDGYSEGSNGRRCLELP